MMQKPPKPITAHKVFLPPPPSFEAHPREPPSTSSSHRRPSPQDAEDGEPECLPRLATAEWLAAFSDAKRNVFGKVTAVFTDEDTARLLGVAQQLQHDNVWPSPQRD